MFIKNVEYLFEMESLLVKMIWYAIVETIIHIANYIVQKLWIVNCWTVFITSFVYYTWFKRCIYTYIIA